ncbi:FadR family transcriptional regulator [Aureimonas fodinaquatilis]|uniref:FadR family transcriptional regulator n=1 Tax=Aureimonas fodinaquatilis TaxID=2565783 RepID=A0A5B0DUA7_9HYPH|nr:FadR/GntR family transcriptional regulator [Aureimonas fodinaquatilis]KAA0969592.1 FadR family transcriptional regulator [Aureimonas fodinaquatilis]
MSDQNELHFLEGLRTAIESEDRALVREGQLPPERELMERYSVGRRTVRAALDALQAEGLVFRRQGQGTFIRPTSPVSTRAVSLSQHTSPAEIMEVRRELEPALAKLSAMRATPSDIDQMKRLVEKGASAKTSMQYERWDSAFHAKIADSVHNSLFHSLFELIQTVRVAQKWTGLRARTYSEALRDELIEQHFEIAKAISDRDPEAAEAAMRAHLRSVTLTTGT